MKEKVKKMQHNNQYSQPPYQQPYDPTNEVLSVGSYVIMFILSGIPVINLICWITWLVSPNTNKNKKNFIKAQIVLWILGVILSIAGVVIAAALGVDLGKALTSI